jgi:hypothetical protein
MRIGMVEFLRQHSFCRWSVGLVMIVPPHAFLRLQYLYPTVWKNSSRSRLLFFRFILSDYLTLLDSFRQFIDTFNRYPSTMNNLHQRIAQIEQISGHTFQNVLCCIESIQMANEVTSVFLEGNRHPIVKSTRLAIIGNDLLNLILSTMWYEHRNIQGIQCVMHQKSDLTTG